MMRWLTHTCVLVLLSVVGTPAGAQTPASDGAVSEAAAGPPALRVVVQATEARLDPYAVQRAIEDELGVAVRGDAHPDVVGTLNVVATGADSLTMEYVGKDGRRNSRTVKLPATETKRLETVALVAGNLARDETGELIEELRPPPAPVADSADTSVEAASPAPTPAAPSTPAPAGGEQRPPAETPPAPTDPETTTVPALEHEFVNVSLFTPIAIHPNSHELEVTAELGLLYSDVGRVSGGALVGLVSRVRHGYQGGQIVGLVSLTNGAARGASLSGLAALHWGDLSGASIAGAANYGEGDLTGGEVAGLFSFRKGNATGFQLSGAFNAAHDVTGAQLSGAVNLTRNISGAQLAGAGNVTRSANGLMLAGGANYATDSVSGVQLAPVNVAETIAGLQFGVVNVARRVDGVQFGVVNVAEEVDGASVGLVPIAGNGYQRFVAWSTPGLASGNAGGKFGIGPMYTLVGVGFDQVDGDERVLPAAAVGMQWEYAPLQLSLDGLYQSSLSTTEQQEQEYFVALRPLVALQVQQWLRLFGGPAFVAGPHDTNGWNQDIKVRASFGVEVFQ